MGITFAEQLKRKNEQWKMEEIKERGKNSKKVELEKKLAKVREEKAIKQFYELDVFMQILEGYEKNKKRPNFEVIDGLSKKYIDNAFKNKNYDDPEVRKKALEEAKKIKIKIAETLKNAEKV